LAVQIIEKLIDDLDGGTATETVRFAYDGVDYTIDLSAKNAARFRKQLRPFVESGVKVTAVRSRASRPAPEDTIAGRAIIRAWAHRTGKYPDLGDRGRIPREIVVAWYAAGQPRQQPGS
jgi:Lsr2